MENKWQKVRDSKNDQFILVHFINLGHVYTGWHKIIFVISEKLMFVFVWCLSSNFKIKVIRNGKSGHPVYFKLENVLKSGSLLDFKNLRPTGLRFFKSNNDHFYGHSL